MSTKGDVTREPDPELGSDTTSSYALECAVPYHECVELGLRGPITAGVNELLDEAECPSSVFAGLVEAVREDTAD